MEVFAFVKVAEEDQLLQALVHSASFSLFFLPSPPPLGREGREVGSTEHNLNSFD